MIDASNLLVATEVALRTTIIKQTTTMVKSRPLEYRRFSWCRWHCTTIVSLSHEWMHSWSRRSRVWVCVDFLRRICWLVEWYNRSWLDGYVLRLCIHMKIGIWYKIVTYIHTDNYLKASRRAVFTITRFIVDRQHCFRYVSYTSPEDIWRWLLKPRSRPTRWCARHGVVPSMGGLRLR